VNSSGFCSGGARPRPSASCHCKRSKGNAPNVDHASAANTVNASAARLHARGARRVGVTATVAHAESSSAKTRRRPAAPANRAAALYSGGRFVAVCSATYFRDRSLRASACSRPNVATVARTKTQRNERADADASVSFRRYAPTALPMTANSATKSAAYSASSAKVVRYPLSESRRRAPAP
jgi:hypothetical protein